MKRRGDKPLRARRDTAEVGRELRRLEEMAPREPPAPPAPRRAAVRPATERDKDFRESLNGDP